MEITPAGLELRSAIQAEIQANGEALCVRRIVEDRCTLSVYYAYCLLKENAERWGFNRERIRKGESFVLRITEA